MLVKPIKDILKLTADQLDLPEKFVEGIVKYYFWWVHRQFDEINYPSVHLPNIGTFYMAKVNYKNALDVFLRKLKERRSNYEFHRDKFRILWKGRHIMRSYYTIKKKRSPINGKNPDYYKSWGPRIEGNSN